MDEDQDLLHRVCAINDFSRVALFEDELPDWRLARELGLFLMRIGHDDLLAHLLVARASRHLGEGAAAVDHLRRCRSLIAEGKASDNPGKEPLLETLETEERFLRETGHS